MAVICWEVNIKRIISYHSLFLSWVYPGKIAEPMGSLLLMIEWYCDWGRARKEKSYFELYPLSFFSYIFPFNHYWYQYHLWTLEAIRNQSHRKEKTKQNQLQSQTQALVCLLLSVVGPLHFLTKRLSLVKLEQLKGGHVNKGMLLSLLYNSNQKIDLHLKLCHWIGRKLHTNLHYFYFLLTQWKSWINKQTTYRRKDLYNSLS